MLFQSWTQKISWKLKIRKQNRINPYYINTSFVQLFKRFFVSLPTTKRENASEENFNETYRGKYKKIGILYKYLR